ncbi:HEAT repeat domain-containing protein [Iningainema sp. BLCCT55]|uniref:HEAT repeat domain-containing protein n=2 Tax=Iningainema TaxID=1932705 RepID=A0A8J6XKN9_9CYAN|nr:HEAT repeat domain-containing protein [Iningainema tapete BLCC-T55]
MDWLGSGVVNAVGFVFRTLLMELTREDLQSFIHSFLTKYRYNQIVPQKQELLKLTLGQALKEFLTLVQLELEDSNLSAKEIEQYTNSLRKFIHNKTVLEELGKPFEDERQLPSANILEQTWQEWNLQPLPNDFNWGQITKLYRRKVSTILREYEELPALLNQHNQVTSSTLNESISIGGGSFDIEAQYDAIGIISNLDLLNYRDAIAKTYGYLRLDSFDTTGYSYNLKLWNMFVAQNVREVIEVSQFRELPKEYLERLKKTEQVEDTDIPQEVLERYKQVYHQQSTHSVLDVTQSVNYQYIMILGDPGSGKSSLLHYLALKWAETLVPDLPSQPIPLLIELRTYARSRNNQESENFIELFQQGSGFICPLNPQQIHQLLRQSKAFVMFDGLDEVFEPSKREEAITDIINFTKTYPHVRVLVTSRVIGYKPQRLQDAKFRHFMLQDLELEQIYTFIDKWHDLAFGNSPEKGRKRDRLCTAINTYSPIRQLAGNPLLLTMMAILNRNQELPRDRAELYNQASRVLLQQWDVEKALVNDTITIDYKDKQAMLRKVAYYMQTNEKGLTGNLIYAADLEDILTRYLTTIEINHPNYIAKLLINQLRERNFILCFLGADYYAFVHRTFLEYFCAWEFVRQFEKERVISLNYLKTEVFGRHWHDESWHEVLRLIAGMIDAKFTGEIIDYLMAQEGEAKKFSNLFLAAKCLSEVRNRTIISSIDSNLFDCLKALTQYKHDSYASNAEEFNLISKICVKAVLAIATTWQGNPKTLPFLKIVADSTHYWAVKQAVVNELVKELVANESDPLPILKMHAQFNNDSDLRIGAIQELASRWKEDPDTLAIIKDRVQIDNDLNVRRIAVHALAEGWKEDIDTLSILKSRAQFDNAWQVRRAAVLELSRRWKDEPGIFEFLCARAVCDPCKTQQYWLNPRKVALEAIIKQYPEHPQTLQLLHDRAENDPDEKLREFAQQKLNERRVTM